MKLEGYRRAHMGQRTNLVPWRVDKEAGPKLQVPNFTDAVALHSQTQSKAINWGRHHRIQGEVLTSNFP